MVIRTRVCNMIIGFVAITMSLETNSVRAEVDVEAEVEAVDERSDQPVTPTVQHAPDTARSWLLLGGGAVLVAAGGLWQWRASDDFAAYDREFAAACTTSPCTDETIPESIAALHDRARRRRVYAVGSYVAGAALMTTGAVLLYVQRGRGDARAPRRSRLAIIGGGMAFVALGGVLQWRADANFTSYDQSFFARCGQTGCLDSDIPDLEDQRQTAQLQARLAVGSYVIGGALVATGLVLAYRDQGARRARRAVSLIPSLSGRRAGLALTGVF